MKKLEPNIKNSFQEKLDTWVEIPDGKIKAAVVMVHGFGIDKHETAGYFDDLSSALLDNRFRVVRFDLSGYGESEGRQEDACYSKHVGDLTTILDYVKQKYPEPIHILAQSMGCFVTAIASPIGITKTIMTGIPNSNSKVIIDRVSKRFGSREGALLNYSGISLLPRSTGKIQKIGFQFWEDIRALDPVQAIREYSIKTQLLLVHWNNDSIIGRDYLAEYDSIPTLKSEWLPGDHSLTDSVDRKNFITYMLNYFNH